MTFSDDYAPIIPEIPEDSDSVCSNEEEEDLTRLDIEDGRTARRMQNSENTLGNHSELVKWLSRFLAIKH